MKVLENLLGIVQKGTGMVLEYSTAVPKFVSEIVSRKPKAETRDRQENPGTFLADSEDGDGGSSHKSDETEAYYDGIRDSEEEDPDSRPYLGPIFGVVYSFRGTMNRTQEQIEESLRKVLEIFGFPSRALEEADKVYRQ